MSFLPTWSHLFVLALAVSGIQAAPSSHSRHQGHIAMHSLKRDVAGWHNDIPLHNLVKHTESGHGHAGHGYAVRKMPRRFRA